jgi:hypothetical protein
MTSSMTGLGGAACTQKMLWSHPLPSPLPTPSAPPSQSLDVPPSVPHFGALFLQAILHPDAHDEGGLACNDKQLLAEMRE